MNNSRVPCYLEFDAATNVVTARHAKTGCIQMTIKLESGMESTHSRIEPNVDCDNFWIAVKPADSTVLDGKLFSRAKLTVQEFKFEIEA